MTKVAVNKILTEVRIENGRDYLRLLQQYNCWRVRFCALVVLEPRIIAMLHPVRFCALVVLEPRIIAMLHPVRFCALVVLEPRIIAMLHPVRFCALVVLEPRIIAMLHPCSAPFCHYNIPIRVYIFLSTKQTGACCCSIAATWSFLCPAKHADTRTIRPTYWWLTGHRWNSNCTVLLCDTLLRRSLDIGRQYSSCSL
jgi:hypothetical protein